MKKTWKLALGAAMALTLVTGCSATEDSGKQQLVVSTWGLSQDVWEQEVKIPFEEMGTGTNRMVFIWQFLHD